MGRVERTREIARRRTRRAKLKKIRARIARTNNPTERTELIAQARKISPFVGMDEEGQS